MAVDLTPKMIPYFRLLLLEAVALIGGIVSSTVTIGTISTLRTFCRHCLLFGKVLEAKRVLTNDNPLWCVACVVLGITTSVSGGCLLLRLLSRKLRQMRPIIQGSLILFCNMSSLLMAGIISMGFHVWCSSFTINRCTDLHIGYMDWKTFQPKYSDCNNAYIFLEHAERSSWVAFISWGIVLTCYTWRTFKEKEQL